MKFNERLKQLRTEKGLTQKQVAEGLDISVSTYSRLGNGKAERLRAPIKLKLYRLYNVRIEYILGIDDIRNNN